MQFAGAAPFSTGVGAETSYTRTEAEQSRLSATANRVVLVGLVANRGPITSPRLA